jgi:hypothetical protein
MAGQECRGLHAIAGRGDERITRAGRDGDVVRVMAEVGKRQRVAPIRVLHVPVVDRINRLILLGERRDWGSREDGERE